jgi:hypothetical protein
MVPAARNTPSATRRARCVELESTDIQQDGSCAIPALPVEILDPRGLQVQSRAPYAGMSAAQIRPHSDRITAELGIKSLVLEGDRRLR